MCASMKLFKDMHLSESSFSFFFQIGTQTRNMSTRDVSIAKQYLIYFDSDLCLKQEPEVLV